MGGRGTSIHASAGIASRRLHRTTDRRWCIETLTAVRVSPYLVPVGVVVDLTHPTLPSSPPPFPSSVSMSSSSFAAPWVVVVVAVAAADVAVVVTSAARPILPAHALPPPLFGFECSINSVGSVYPPRYATSTTSPIPWLAKETDPAVVVVPPAKGGAPAAGWFPLVMPLFDADAIIAAAAAAADEDEDAELGSSRALAARYDRGRT